MVKKLIIPFLLTFMLLLIPKDTYAQTIYNTGVTLKNASNTSVLYSGGINLEQTNIAYQTGKIEFPFSTSVAYENSYSFTMDYYINIPYTTNYQNLGFGNPELYVSSNGLVQQAIQISQFNNTLQACGTLACTYRINLSFTFGSNAAGSLYLAIPVTPAFPIYGYHYNNIDLTSYGQNTSNSDIINNNNQNTQNIINNQNQNTQAITNNNNQNTQNIINNNNSNTDKLLDDSLPSDTDDKLSDLTDNDNLPSNVGIQDLITLPIRLYTSIVSSANSCIPVCFELLDTDFCLPCFDIGAFFGTYWSIFDMLLCFVLLFKFASKLKEIFVNITQLDENKGELIE